MSTQTAQIKKHLHEVGSISGIEASALYKCRSLPRRICDLKEQGLAIDAKWQRDITGQRYVRYRLSEA